MLHTAKAAFTQLRSICAELNLSVPEHWLWVDVSTQHLYRLRREGEILQKYPVSTAKKGVGNQEGSYQTPLGLHRIAEKIGAGCEEGSIFKGRQPTGACAAIESQPIATGEDCITSRILWLQGLQPHINKGEGCDSYARYIYIHGTHEEGLLGQPASIGCVRMKNTDVVELFEWVEQGSWVLISA